jgi:hypothetical protein
MHQCLQPSGYVTVVDEEVFFDVECFVTALKITGVIVFNSMPQDQILRARGCTNWVCLNETNSVKRAWQCG